MICQHVQMPGGGTAIVCSEGRRRRCSCCSGWSTKLCDGPPPAGSKRKTCDVPLCSGCARHVDGQDLDYCPTHAELAGGRGQLQLEPRGGPPRSIADVIRAVPGSFEIQETAPVDDEPKPNSPEDVGFTDSQIREPATPKQHEPKKCSSCSAPILWAQTIDDQGRRIPRDGGRFKSMPVDWEPTDRGNVVVYHRQAEGFVCRVLGRGKQPRAGEKLRTSHFATCPQAKQHRRSRTPNPEEK